MSGTSASVAGNGFLRLFSAMTIVNARLAVPFVKRSLATRTPVRHCPMTAELAVAFIAFSVLMALLHKEDC